MHATDIHLLFEFNSWANARMLESVEQVGPADYLRDLGSSHGGLHGTFVHMMGAEAIWLERWNGRSPEKFFSAADFPGFSAVRERWSAIDRDLVAFAQRLRKDDDLLKIVAYRDLKGNPYTQPLWQLMQHLVNHSTYHRGQIVTMLRQMGAKPVGTDLVAYYRLRPS